MAWRGLVALAASFPAFAAAATSGTSSGQTVWASFAFIMHGERTPLMGEIRTAEALTPNGAIQMTSQGSMFRSRYLRAPYVELDKNETGITTREPIRNLAQESIDNTQLHIFTEEDPFLAASALAFMQGLYPPNEDKFSQAMGGDSIAMDSSTGTLVEYPMGGYQYPAIKTYTENEQGSIFVGGTGRCPKWVKSAYTDLIQSDWDKKNFNNGRGTAGFYQGLFTEAAFNGTSTEPFSQSDLNIYNGYDIWDFVRYMRDHNKTVAQNLKGNGNSEDSIDPVGDLKFYANMLTFEQNSKTGNNIRNIAGRTLASKVLEVFAENRVSNGTKAKLSLTFGSYHPIRAFAALAGLTKDSFAATSEPWRSLPDNGAAMVFEIFGRNPKNPTTYPDPENMKVRFYFRGGVDTGDAFVQYGLFDHSAKDEGMAWKDFEDAMKKIAVDQAEWCSMCSAVTTFCQASAALSTYQPRSKSAVISGIIGAAIILLLLAIVGIVLFFFFGMRIGKKDGSKNRGSVGGGFKGREKMQSDTDLAISQHGARHERVGSWELKDGDDSVPGGGATFVKGGMTGNTRKLDEDEEAILEMGMKPVHPRESV